MPPPPISTQLTVHAPRAFHIYIYVYIYTCTPIYIYIYIYDIYIYYIHTYIYIRALYIYTHIYIYILYSRGVEKRKEGLEGGGIKNSGGERERVRGEEERGKTEGAK
jgi:hypothetical protein